MQVSYKLQSGLMVYPYGWAWNVLPYCVLCVFLKVFLIRGILIFNTILSWDFRTNTNDLQSCEGTEYHIKTLL